MARAQCGKKGKAAKRSSHRGKVSVARGSAAG
jgi:hypothetical protein